MSMSSEVLAGRVAEELLGRLPDCETPPAIEQLLEAVGARVVCDERPGVEGETTWSNGQPTIRVPFESPSRGRQTFTLAHEIAHVVIAQSSEPHALRLHESGGAALESLCDNVAARVLVPSDWLERQAPATVDFSDVRRIAEACSLSWSATAVRLKTSGRDLILIKWRRVGGRWLVTSAVGLWRSRWSSLELHDPRIRSAAQSVTATLCREEDEAQVTLQADGLGKAMTTFAGAELAGPLRRWIHRQ